MLKLIYSLLARAYFPKQAFKQNTWVITKLFCYHLNLPEPAQLLRASFQAKLPEVSYDWKEPLRVGVCIFKNIIFLGFSLSREHLCGFRATAAGSVPWEEHLWFTQLMSQRAANPLWYTNSRLHSLWAFSWARNGYVVNPEYNYSRHQALPNKTGHLLLYKQQVLTWSSGLCVLIT